MGRMLGLDMQQNFTIGCFVDSQYSLFPLAYKILYQDDDLWHNEIDI